MKANPKFTWKENALKYAASDKDFDGIEALLAMGADPTISPYGSNEMGSASVMHSMRYPEYPDVLEYLLKRGYDPNCATEETKETPLHNLASYWRGINVNDCERTAKLFLQYGADINAKDYRGRTPLDIAREHLSQYQAIVKRQEKIIAVLEGKDNA